MDAAHEAYFAAAIQQSPKSGYEGGGTHLESKMSQFGGGSSVNSHRSGRKKNNMQLLTVRSMNMSSTLSEARRSMQDITIHKVDGVDESDESADSNDLLVMSKKKIRPKANLSTANRD